MFSIPAQYAALSTLDYGLVSSGLRRFESFDLFGRYGVCVSIFRASIMMSLFETLE